MRNWRNVIVAMTAAVTAAGFNSTALARCDVWQPLGSGIYPYSHSESAAQALATYKGELIVGGAVRNAGGQEVNSVAAWNGTNWHSLGSGMNSDVAAFTIFNGELIAGGNFATAGGIEAQHIARWDGTAWQSMGAGFDGAVYALATYNGELIAAGAFANAGGQPCNHIARWDGSAWQPLGAGVGGSYWEQPRALAVYAGELVVGGSFTTAGGQNANYIARWNGSTWQPLGSGMSIAPPTSPSIFVIALAVHDGELIAGGRFAKAGGQSAHGIARWNGTAWHRISSGINAEVHGLTNYNQDLVACGRFHNAGGQVLSGIARWNGKAWLPMGIGFSSCDDTDLSPDVLAIYKGDLIAGGIICMADGQLTNNIARWHDCISKSSKAPFFSNPLSITNRYFPFVPNGSKVFVGDVYGSPTIVFHDYLASTREFNMPGKGSVECRILQETRYVTGQLREIHKKYFAQADDGSVYQFGEIVTGYQDNQVVVHSGSWLVGGASRAADPLDAIVVSKPSHYMPSHPRPRITFKSFDLNPLIFRTRQMYWQAPAWTVPAGTFNDIIFVHQSRLLVLGVPAWDYSGYYEAYAPGIGLIQSTGDGEENFRVDSLVSRSFGFNVLK